MIVDFTRDAGFEKLALMYMNGELKTINANTDLDFYIQKQAYADDDTFADPQNRLFSIASREETEISARYAEKVAYLLEQPVKDAINESCAMYGIPLMKEASAPVVEPSENLGLLYQETEMDKYAGATEYGTELDTCLAARAIYYPEEAEELQSLAKMASELSPDQMVSIIREFDESVGADSPMMQSRVGSPEYAVFEKRASEISVNLGTKKVPFERMAEIGDKLTDMGIDIDFDENDPATTALAIERLPDKVKENLAKYIPD